MFVEKITCNARPADKESKSKTAFEHDPAAALVTIHLGASIINDVIPRRFLLLVPVRTLYHEIQKALSRPKDRRPETTQWSHWGPHGSLLLPLNDESRRKEFSFIHHLDVFGPRLALPFQDMQEPRGTEEVVFLDFSRAARRNQRTDSATLARFHSSTSDWGNTFAESVRQSSLPYQVIAGPRIVLREPQDTWPVSVRMVVQPDGFALMVRTSYLFECCDI